MWKSQLIVDTIGYPFVYPLLRVFGFKILAYVHYPFIHLDVVEKHKWRGKGRPDAISSLKARYYDAFTRIYAAAGNCVHSGLCNSSWTFNHIKRMWTRCPKLETVFPPCDLRPFLQIEHSNDANNEFIILSLGQFRPEKNHRLQLEIAEKVCKQAPAARFVFIGGCRDARDEARVQELKDYARVLGVEKNVSFLVNLPFPALMHQLSEATVGIHTMTEEHFGIGVVELMAAGLITIAHNSGGPKADIINNKDRNNHA